MNILSKIISLMFFAILPGLTLAQNISFDKLHGLGKIKYHEITADSSEQNYFIFVRLPDSYNESKTYPTVYLLDGGITFPLLSAYYHYLRIGEEMPDLIIVGISYGSDDWQQGNNRSQDFTAPAAERSFWGGAADFQQFLKQQLITFIEEQYSCNKERRIIFGQSLGGQFVLYTALTKPHLFWGHIASNPALHRNLDLFLGADSLKKYYNSIGKLYVSSGADDNPRFRRPALKWMEYWNKRQNLPWLLKTETLEDHSHFSAAPIAFRNGLRWIFSRTERNNIEQPD